MIIKIPGYRIDKELGHGGMATVYLAEQESLGRQVALKVMAPALAADRTFSERFLKEARTVAHLTHPHILTIHDVGVVDHHHYLALEYLPGGDLKSLLRDGRLSPSVAAQLTREVAAALSYAHGKGFVHRDVKPENILFREDGSAVLSDFGIARAVASHTRMTGTGMSVGTPHYMSPEQARGQTVDPRSDLYALGVVFYEMLTGQVPFDAADSIAIGIQHVTAPLPRLPSPLAAYQPLLDRLLAKTPEERYAGADELIAALDRTARGEEAESPSVTRVWRVSSGEFATAQGATADPVAAAGQPDSKKGVPGWLWGGVGALAAAVLLGGVWLFQEQTSPPPRVLGGGGGGVATTPLPTLPPESAVPSEWPDRWLVGRSDPEEELREAEPEPEPEPVVDDQQQPAAEAERERQAAIERLLRAAEDDLANNRLMAPEGRNAFERYQAIRELEPDHPSIVPGLERIVERYAALIESTVANQQFDRAQAFVARAAEVQPQSDRVAELRSAVATAQEAHGREESRRAEAARRAEEMRRAEAARRAEEERRMHAALIAGRYRIVGNGAVVEDTQTGLQWMRCSLGQRWDGQTCGGHANYFTWHEARQVTDRYAGWRLPTIEELRTLRYCSGGEPALFLGGRERTSCGGHYQRPTIVQEAFPNTPARTFWSASPYVGTSGHSWNVHFHNGNDNWLSRSSPNRVRLVRDVQ
ncbi:hypothetical protein CKO15_05670 [Halorhodospira abdelmalekii]|uniref:protein kinase domain-containing protein n=1 Tax=Halorhodospira abdelmalekii TaxID=421629 RepID=UPI00190784A5|nr:protein kinase [Halorhodospira abdelmalekii]MBK1734785.1 hypothetical protein [Halorhodospira abdelmalekii]